MENGYTFRPINWIRGYNDIDEPDFWTRKEDELYVLWNTPTWLDRWLWLNCPLSFVRDRLREQYGDENDEDSGLKDFENWKYEDMKKRPDFGKQKYTFLKFPKWHGVKWFMNNARRKNPYPGKSKQLNYEIEIISPNGWTEDLDYDEKTDAWYKTMGMLPCGNDGYIWQYYHKRIPTKKSIIRELRRWYIPRGYIVKLVNLRYKGMNIEILVK